MKVLVLGGYRTGSTHAYWLTCKVLDAQGRRFRQMGCNAETLPAELARPGLAVLKTHELNPAVYQMSREANIRIVFTKRNPYDVAGSLRRMKGQPDEKILAELRRSMQLELELKTQIRVLWTILDYDALYGHDAEKVTLIAELLGVRLPERRIVGVATHCSIEAARRIASRLKDLPDPYTELRHNHIGDSPEPGGYTLENGLRAAIDEELKRWPEFG